MGALTAAAAAEWTARDLDQLLIDVAATGRPILADPRRPISYLCHLLSRVDVNERPTALIDAQAAEDLAHRQARTTDQLDRRDVDAAARATGVAALAGPGRAAALSATRTAAVAAERRRSERAAADRVALGEEIARRRSR